MMWVFTSYVFQAVRMLIIQFSYNLQITSNSTSQHYTEHKVHSYILLITTNQKIQQKSYLFEFIYQQKRINHLKPNVHNPQPAPTECISVFVSFSQ